jgi:hypothetical protein
MRMQSIALRGGAALAALLTLLALALAAADVGAAGNLAVT